MSISWKRWLVALSILSFCCCGEEKPVAKASKPLRLVLREAVAEHAKKKSATGSPGKKDVSEDLELIVDVMSRFLHPDNEKLDAAGELVEKSHQVAATGEHMYAVVWRRTVSFSLEAPSEGTQPVIMLDTGIKTRILVKLPTSSDGKPSAEKRIKGVKDFPLSVDDPLCEALTISGFADKIVVTDNKNGTFTALVETPSVELTIRDSTLANAKLLK